MVSMKLNHAHFNSTVQESGEMRKTESRRVVRALVALTFSINLRYDIKALWYL